MEKLSNTPLVIAIDGPAASGKGSLGRRLAQHFGMEYLDTGKLYRYVGLKLLEEGFDAVQAEDEDSPAAKKATEIAKNIKIHDLGTANLMGEGVGKAASIVSALPSVRKALLEFQKNVAESSNGAVLDGRDIGTIVCPEADFKFFITANLEIRSERRFKELQKKDNRVIYTSVLEDLRQRDERDSKRSISPLVAAGDAICIDTTALDLDEVFEQVLDIIRGRSE